jgi:surface antigen Omp85-like protein
MTCDRPYRPRVLPVLCAGGVILLMFLPGIARAQNSATATKTPQAQSASEDGLPAGLLAEPGVIGRSLDFVTRKFGEQGDEAKNGFYPELGNMITGAGWITAGPGYRHHLWGARAIADGSAALSWREYKMAQGRFELTDLAHNHIAAGTQIRWQDLTQITFFGVGNQAPESDRSQYRLKSTDVTAYATLRPAHWLSVNGGAGWLQRPALEPPAGSFKRDFPFTGVVSPDDPVFALSEQPNFVHGDADITADSRNHPNRPSSGGLYRAAWSAYSDRDAGQFSFQRYEAEGAQFVPLAGGRVVLAGHGWLVASSTSSGNEVPFYLMPSLGGHNTLRGFSDYRFHDRNLLDINAETRVALFRHIDGAVFADAGNVAPHVGDLNLDKRSYGFGFRVHSRESTFARLDVGHSQEGWHAFFRLSDPLSLARRIGHRTADVPFVP